MLISIQLDAQSSKDQRDNFMLKIPLFASALFALSLTSYAAPIQLQDVQDPKQQLQKTASMPNGLILIRKGAGKNNVVQGVALDNQRNLLYTTHVTGKPEKGAINRFIFGEKANYLVAQDVQKPSDMIGHQGISVDPISGDIFASAGSALQKRGWKIVRFTYTPNEVPQVKPISVFTQGYSTGVNTMPSFSPDGQYLAIRGHKNKVDVIRIYTRDFLNNPTVVKPLYEWKVDSGLTGKNYPFQSMTTDGKYVYMISGNSQPDLLKRLRVYTLDGQLVQKIDDMSIGRQAAKHIGPTSVWEPEGLTFNQKAQQLYILYGVGEHRQKVGQIYKINVH